VIGSVVGMIPGLGSNTAAWLAYGHVVQTSKHPERFGKGAVEGVMAPEFSSNAREGGSLLPTLFFGIPGSSGMAVLMGAFIILGIQPGPTMMTTQLPLVWTLIWALVIGNLIAVAFLMVIMRWAAVLTFVNGAILVPFIIVLAVIGSYVNEGQWENLVVLVLISVVGYAMLRFNWPRAPFVIGLVLGRVSEESLHKALGLWGWQFFLRPLSLVLIGLIVATIAFAIYKNTRPTKAAPQLSVAQ
jgi:putative tricarboxylic transport membrane protein